MGVVVFLTCPPASNASLSHVEMVKHGSTSFYLLRNQTAPTGEEGIRYNYDVWFTNSTVICVTPASPTPTCRTLPTGRATITIPTPSASSPDSSDGLRLGLSLSANSTGMLDVIVTEHNTLDRPYTITTGGHWPVNGMGLFLWTGAMCSNTTIGYEILQGNYEESNYTKGSALSLGIQSPIQCPGHMGDEYPTIKPLGDVVRSGVWSGSWFGGLGVSGGVSCPDPEMNPNPRNYCPLMFVSFAPGNYTAVAGDEWGRAVILHFTVQW
jgi:hypothetical protein